MLLSCVIRDYDLEKVILSILNIQLLVQEFINRYIFSLIQETNWLVNKGMCVLLFDVFNECSLVKVGKGMLNIYYWEKLTSSKHVGKVIFSETKFEELH